MGKNNNLFAFISILFASLIILTVNAAIQTATLTLYPPYTPAPPAGLSLTQQAPQTFLLSPANTVNQYNTENGLWLTTCPTAPQNPGFSPTNPLWPFYSNPSPDYGDWQASGDSCELPATPSNLPVSLIFTTNSMPPIINGLPSAATAPTVTFSMQGAALLSLGNIGYTPEVISPDGNIISTAYDTKTNIFQNIPVQGQDGVWSWWGLTVDLAQLNALYYSNGMPLETTTTVTGNIYSDPADPDCSYTYDAVYTTLLQSIGPATISYPITDQATSTHASDLLPYLIYDGQISNSEPANEFDTQISYDIYSPQNFYNAPDYPSTVDPFPINSLPLFFSDTYAFPIATFAALGIPAPAIVDSLYPYGGNFVYYNAAGVSFDSSSANQIYGLKYPYGAASTTVTTTSTGGTGGNPPTASCPNNDNSGTLSPQEVYACAYDAGFRGQQLAIMTVIPWYEEQDNAQGSILGNPGDNSNNRGYNPATCSTPDWHLNPTCEYAWAAVYITYYADMNGGLCPNGPDHGYGGVAPPVGPHDFCYWGTYRNLDEASTIEADYCLSMPAAYSGENCPAGDAGTQPADGMDAAFWASVGLTNPGTGWGTAPGTGNTQTPTSSIVQIAETQIGVPYCEGNPQAPKGQSGIPCSLDIDDGGDPLFTATSGSFDCSGFVQWVYEQLGIQITRQTTTQWANPLLVTVPQAATVPGDLVYYFEANDDPSTPGHVVMCITDGCTQIIQASRPGQPLGEEALFGTPCPANGYVDGCIMGFKHVTGSPTTTLTATTSAVIPTVFTTQLTVNSIAAIPQGYIFVLGQEPTPPSNQVAEGCVAPTATLPTPAEASVYDGDTAYYTETITSSEGTLPPTPPFTYDWYTGYLTADAGNGDTAASLGSCSSASCTSAADCVPSVVQTSTSTSINTGIGVGDIQASCDVWVDVVNACTQPYTYSGNARLDSYSGGSSATSSPNPNTPPPSIFTPPTIPPFMIYTLKVVPPGQFNSSEYQPNSVVSAQDQKGYTANWDTYWQNELQLQGSSVYVLGSYPLTQDSQLKAIGFFPFNITSDYYGDVFITGVETAGADPGSPWIVSISNVVGPGTIELTAEPLCPSSSGSITPPDVCSNIWPEITVSPTGGQIYLANRDSGYIPIFSGATLTYQSTLSLDFDTDNALYGAIAQTTADAHPGFEGEGVNIEQYFANGGLYNITAMCGASGEPACSGDDLIMQHIISAYQTVQDLYPQTCLGSFTCIRQSQDPTDKADWPDGNNPNNNYHHPIGITDVNGYLYVLDDWAGVGGETCTLATFSDQCFLGHSAGGILFNVLDLRIINSSGVDVPIIPSYADDLWYCWQVPTPGAKQNCQEEVQPTGLEYPPFGWIISANVTAQNAQDSFGLGGNGPLRSIPSLSLCSGNSATCEQPYTGPGGYHGTLMPIGPALKDWGHNQEVGGYYALNISEAGFSVSFNNTVSVYIPSEQQVADGYGGVANMGSELIFAQMDPENYTLPVGGTEYLPFTQKINYNCFTNDTDQAAGFGNGPSALCNYDNFVSNIIAPVYMYTNPFEYDSNIGSYQQLTLQEELSSDLNPGSSTYGSANPGCASGQSYTCFGINNPAAFNTQFNNAAGTSFYPLSNQQPIAPTQLSSQINGYLLLPYEVTYQSSYYVNNIEFAAGTGVPCALPPPALAALESPQLPPTQQLYNSTSSQNTPSVIAAANVESGSTYATSNLNSTRYYEPLLLGIEAPQQLYYDLLTNRVFGDIYINGTYNAFTNKQGVINSTTLYTYSEDEFTQGTGPGGFPAYADIVATPKTPPCIGPGATCSSAVGLTQPNTFDVMNNLTTPAHAGPPLLIDLFDWYKVPVYDSGVFLTLNGSIGATKAYGYHRLVFTYNDRFNNTIYMPLDVDIANITQIALNVTPFVNATNANQTNIVVNGTAYWIPPFSTNAIPLKNGYIYLYYDANLNTIGYNAVGDPTDAATCAFANTTQPDICDYADPVYNGLEYNSVVTSTTCPNAVCIATALNKGLYPDGTPYISPNTITYHPSTNSMGGNMCSPPPNSLLTPTNQIYTECNIYGSSTIPASTQNSASALCPDSTSGYTQYCSPIFANGTGICTPEVGLFDIATTNALGYFSANILSCGYGFHTIVAKYYGTPGPEPIYAHQSLLPLAYNTSTPLTAPKSITFQPFNYSWTPVQSTLSVATGTILLRLGNISVPLAILMVAALVVAAALITHYRKSKVKPSKRLNTRKAKR